MTRFWLIVGYGAIKNYLLTIKSTIMDKKFFLYLSVLLVFINQVSFAQNHKFVGRERLASTKNLEYLFSYEAKNRQCYRFMGDYVTAQDRNLLYLTNGQILDIGHDYKRLPNFVGKYIDLKNFCDWAVKFFPKAKNCYIESYLVKSTDCNRMVRAVYTDEKIFRFGTNSTQNCLICVDRNRERRDVWLLSKPVKVYREKK